MRLRALFDSALFWATVGGVAVAAGLGLSAALHPDTPVFSTTCSTVPGCVHAGPALVIAGLFVALWYAPVLYIAHHHFVGHVRLQKSRHRTALLGLSSELTAAQDVLDRAAKQSRYWRWGTRPLRTDVWHRAKDFLVDYDSAANLYYVYLVPAYVEIERINGLLRGRLFRAVRESDKLDIAVAAVAGAQRWVGVEFAWAVRSNHAQAQGAPPTPITPLPIKEMASELTQARADFEEVSATATTLLAELANSQSPASTTAEDTLAVVERIVGRTDSAFVELERIVATGRSPVGEAAAIPTRAFQRYVSAAEAAPFLASSLVPTRLLRDWVDATGLSLVKSLPGGDARLSRASVWLDDPASPEFQLVGRSHGAFGQSRKTLPKNETIVGMAYHSDEGFYYCQNTETDTNFEPLYDGYRYRSIYALALGSPPWGVLSVDASVPNGFDSAQAVIELFGRLISVVVSARYRALSEKRAISQVTRRKSARPR